MMRTIVAVATACAALVGHVANAHEPTPAASGLQLDLCAWGEAHASDPCLPGGKYDPLLKRCAGAMPGSECYACFTGPNCQTLASNTSDCTVVSGGGNPLLFQEYWEQQTFDGCTSVPTSYREGYQVRGAAAAVGRPRTCVLTAPRAHGQTMGNFAPISDVEDAIRFLHGVVGNADTTDHEVVLGFGSTQVMAVSVARAACHT